MSLGRDCFDTVRIPDDKVSVRAHGDAALPWVQVEDLSSVGAGYSHKLVLIHFTSHLVKEQRHDCISKAQTCTNSISCRKQIPEGLVLDRDLLPLDGGGGWLCTDNITY